MLTQKSITWKNCWKIATPNQIDPSSFKQELSALKKDMKNFDSKLNQILTQLKVSEVSK